MASHLDKGGARGYIAAMFDAHELRRRLAKTFEGATIEVRDLTGTGDHFAVVVVASDFEGRDQIARHRMVYAPLRDVMGGALHALALTTQTPHEASTAAQASPLRIQP